MPTKIDGLVVLGASLFYKEKKVTRLNGMQMIFAHQAWRLSRRLLIGLLMICGMFPSLVQAEIWRRTATSGMKDVAIAPNGLIWLTGKDGTVWTSDNVYGSSFTQIEASGFSRISVGPSGVVWAVGPNGTLWKFAGSWTKTAANGIGDVAIAPNGLIWLAGKNGTIWSSPDDGVTFSQDEQASGIENIATGRGGAWAVGFNGTLWRKLFSPQL